MKTNVAFSCAGETRVSFWSQGLLILPIETANGRNGIHQVSKTVGEQTWWPCISEQDAARQIRAMWMRKMGLSEQEIREGCYGDDPPASLAEEKNKLAALERLKGLSLTRGQLERWAMRY